MDVSALALTRAGTARHIRSLLAALGDEDIAMRRYALGGSSRALVPVRDVGWYLAALPAKARLDRMAVLHCPTQRAPVRSQVPLVVTFHDLAVLRHPDAFNRWTREYSRRVLPRVAEAATRLIAVSEFTKRELLEVLDVPEDKVRVIPNAVGEPFTAEGEAAEGDYVLAVSTLEPRKNLPRLVEGYERARLNGLPLLVAGAAGWGDVPVDGRRRALARRGRRRGAGAALPRRALRRLRLALRGVRPARAGGDGLRNAGRRGADRSARGGLRRRGGARRPARPGRDRGGSQRGDRPARGSARARASNGRERSTGTTSPARRWRCTGKPQHELASVERTSHFRRCSAAAFPAMPGDSPRACPVGTRPETPA